jgi:hypothetical protein
MLLNSWSDLMVKALVHFHDCWVEILVDACINVYNVYYTLIYHVQM